MINTDKKAKDNKAIYQLTLSILPKTSNWYADGVRGIAVREWHAFDVFTSVNKAVAAGKKEIRKKLKELKAQVYKDRSIEDIVEYEIDCRFTIYEFDPDCKRTRKGGWWDDYAEWTFNHKGELLHREQYYIVIEDEEKYYLSKTKLPSDDRPDAGTKFKAGDFVTVVHRHNSYGLSAYAVDGTSLSKKTYSSEEYLYVVAGKPGRKVDLFAGAPRNDPNSWENYYTIGAFNEQGGYTHDHPHETGMRHFEGEVPNDHPLQFLRKWFTGEITINSNVVYEIYDQKILFDYQTDKKSWRDIPELIEAMNEIK